MTGTVWTAMAVVALVGFRPNGATPRASRYFGRLPAGGVAVAMLWLGLGVPAAVAMGTYQPALLSQDGVILGAGNLVVLEPEKWIGKRFPLLDWIQTDAELDRGRWTVVMHRRGCPKCERLIHDYENGDLQFGSEAVAFVALESCDRTPLRPVFRADSLGCMQGEYSWFAEAPLELHVDDSQLVSIRERPSSE